MAFCPTCDPSSLKDVTIISIFAFLALLAVVFRLWARTIKSIRLDLNDYLCIGGLVFTLASTILSIQSYVYWGFFSVSAANDPKTLATQFKALISAELLWIAAVTLIRASIIFLYIHIFFTKPFRIACYVVLTLNLAFFTATVLTATLICRPFQYNWDRSVPGTCGDRNSLSMFLAVFNLLMDVATVALPLPVLSGLQMPIGRKIALIFLFSMGIAICAITLVRIKVTTNITPENASAKYAMIALLTCLEQSLGVINACLPVSRPVFDKLRPTSLISALSGWASSKRSHSSRDYQNSSTPRQASWPMEVHRKRHFGHNSLDSAVDLPDTVWSPPVSPHKGAEEK